MSLSLKDLHTKQLLAYLKRARALPRGYSPDGDYVVVYTVEQLKEELAKREHIPNREERGALRKALAQDKKNR